MLMRMPRLIVMGSLVLMGAACTQADDSTATADSSPGAVAATSADASAIRASIDSMNAIMSDALERGDTTAAGSIYADDVVVMMSNMEAARGRDAARNVWKTMLSQGAFKDVSMKTDDIVVGGDLIVETGKYEFTLQPKTGKEIKDKGKYVVVWKRQPDGSLKAIRDIGNTDLPATR
jgi:ketosteroid isomerase-like protein